MQTALLLVVFGSGLVAATVGTRETEDARLKLVKDYRKWNLVTASPEDMSPAMVTSCTGPAQWDRDPNPHFPRVFLVFVNQVGKKAMLKQGKTHFPDGTVIVKEKHPRDPGGKKEAWTSLNLMTEDLLKSTPELVTVMAKRKGKWEYFAVDSSGKIMDGDVAYCGKCHEAKRENDYVFRPYVR